MSRPEYYRKLLGVTMNSFGWRADEFWRATPHELTAMFEARQEENRRMEESS